MITWKNELDPGRGSVLTLPRLPYTFTLTYTATCYAFATVGNELTGLRYVWTKGQPGTPRQSTDDVAPTVALANT